MLVLTVFGSFVLVDALGHGAIDQIVAERIDEHEAAGHGRHQQEAAP